MRLCHSLPSHQFSAALPVVFVFLTRATFPPSPQDCVGWEVLLASACEIPGAELISEAVEESAEKVRKQCGNCGRIVGKCGGKHCRKTPEIAVLRMCPDRLRASRASLPLPYGHPTLTQLVQLSPELLPSWSGHLGIVSSAVPALCARCHQPPFLALPLFLLPLFKLQFNQYPFPPQCLPMRTIL